MTNETKSNTVEMDARLARLQELFDTYGSDTARWPAAARQLWDASAADPAFIRMAAEAAAFDRLLDAGVPAADAARLDALTGRIMSAASANAPPSNVLPFLGRPAPSAVRITAATRRASYAALAASLVLGLLVGTSGAGNHAISYLSGQGEEESEIASSSLFSPAMDEVL